MKIQSQSIEIAIHLLLWLLYFTSINVDWTTDWFDKSLRPNTPAPLSVLIFPLFFYANAFWLVPRYFHRKKWPYYLLFGFLVFLLPELLRAGLVSWAHPTVTFGRELNSRDSLLFGAPSVLFIALNLSFGYRFTRDWFVNRRLIQDLQKAESSPPSESAGQSEPLISDNEARQLLQRLQEAIVRDQPYLNPNLSLRGLAALIDTTDKKLSYLLNQQLATNFYDYINLLRIETFKEKVSQGATQQLSIVGIATECGFRSKSSFYRAFKKHLGISPSDYLAQISS